MKTAMKLQSLPLIVLVVAVTAVPFLNKAYHIDDPFVLAVSKQILETPLDPFAGKIDWFGYESAMWEATTNPPFLSYYLAPFAAKFNFSEIALHSAMMLFLVLLAWGTTVLSNRFTHGSNWPLLFLMFSTAVMVSGNVMRDVPAAGLAVAGIALFVLGTDRENWLYMLSGSVLAGLAVLTKYSSVIVFPVMLLYPFLHRKYWLMGWIIPGLLVLLAWCLHNEAFYGQMHIVYLTLNRRAVEGIPWQDKACGALVILGSMVYITPALLWSFCIRKRWAALAGALPVGLTAFWAVERHFDWSADGQYSLWAVLGAILLYGVLLEGFRRGIPYVKNIRDERAADALFLFAWVCAPVIFSVFLVPFQAVRHQIVTLVPLLLLAFRSINISLRLGGVLLEAFVVVLFFVQAAVSYAVAVVDYQYADTYRQMAAYVKDKYVSPDHETWYAGHWGWKYYADQAGLRQRHRDQALPKPGDILAWPLRVHYGEVFGDIGDPFKILEHGTIEKKEYTTPIPIRTMNFHGASFYAVIGNNVPYRFFQDIDLETLKVFRVKDYDPNEVLPRPASP